ncbi:MAG: prefoldin subunit [archaeon]
MSEQDKKIQEIHFLEQNIQNFLFQKQAFQIELTETRAALEEIEKSGDEVFKIIGQLMIKSEKPKIKKELLDKEKALNLRMKTIEKQENSIKERLNGIRKEIVNK